MHKYKVGVYGTLKQGWGNHRLLENSVKIADGWVSGYRLYQSGIPFLIKDDTSEYKVKVEVYEVDEYTLERLDCLEGHPTCYCREQLQVETDDADVLTAWVYEYPTACGKENTTGIF